MVFGSKKGMDDLHYRLYIFRNLARSIMTRPELTAEEDIANLEKLDELIEKLANHDKSVFNKNFSPKIEYIEDYLEPISYETESAYERREKEFTDKLAKACAENGIKYKKPKKSNKDNVRLFDVEI
jgi:hypothetical protein